MKRAEFRNMRRVMTDRLFCRELLEAESVDALIFLDETHLAKRDLQRTRGRSRKGRAPVLSQDYIPELAAVGATLITACNVHGLLPESSLFYPHAVCRDVFEMWLRDFLVPHLKPYPGPNSVVVMDNASIHHGGDVQRIIETSGDVVLYLSPYSCGYNPIEKVFSKLKAFLKRHSLEERFQNGTSLWVLVMQGLGTVTASDMANYFRNCYLGSTSQLTDHVQVPAYSSETVSPSWEFLKISLLAIFLSKK